MSKTALWDKLGKTDPSHTKPFKRSGGFSGTAIKPMWAYKRMTEEFGACGEGWGITEPSFQVVPGPDGEVLVFCTVSVWHGTRENAVFGVGGDKVVGKNRYGLATDDEAFKKAFTDGITNALKLIGVGADVHMGMFDDNKYVNTMRDEFAEQKAPPGNKPAKASDSDRTIADVLISASNEAKTLDDFKEWKTGQNPRIAELGDFERKRVSRHLKEVYDRLLADAPVSTLEAG